MDRCYHLELDVDVVSNDSNSLTYGPCLNLIDELDLANVNESPGCDEIPECNLDICRDTNRILSHDGSLLHALCYVEGMAHTFILRSFVATFIYICINLIRKYLIRALNYHYWIMRMRHEKAAGTTDNFPTLKFEFTGLCTFDGKPTDIDQLADLTLEIEKKFKRMMYMYIVFTCIVSVVCIGVSYGIAYNLSMTQTYQ